MIENLWLGGSVLPRVIKMRKSHLRVVFLFPDLASWLVDPYTRTTYCASQAEGAMRVINFSDAGSQLKQVIDQVVDDADYTVIARRDAQNAVVKSLETFNSLMETRHLIKSPANARHLEKSLTQYRKGQTKSKG